MNEVKHLTTVADLTGQDIEAIYRIAADTKRQIKQGVRGGQLAGRVLGMIFEKPSMRTRLSFEAAMIQAGGHALDIRGPEIGLGEREDARDVARVMSRYVDAIMVRTFEHENVEALARNSEVPVINGLSDYAHPCQALADLFTVREKLGSLEDVRLAFVGDGNNVARSLAMLCGRLGVQFTLSAPAGHEFDAAFLAKAAAAVGAGPEIAMTPDPAEAVKAAHVVYTDVWASMGQEDEAAERKKTFRPYQLNADLMSHAPEDALVMHCLPAHRGDEITDDVMDGPDSIIYDQAENRLHVQKGLLFFLLGAEGA